MTAQPVSVAALIEARESLIGAIVGGMPLDHRRFLMSVKKGTPDWPLVGLPAAQALPAVRWRLENLARLDERKRAKLLGELGKVLGLQ